MFKKSISKNFLSVFVVTMMALTFVVSSFFIAPNHAEAQSIGDIAGSIARGAIVLDFCTDVGQGGVVTNAVEGGLDSLGNALSDTGFVNKLQGIADKVSNIPGVGGIIGGIASGFLGGGEQEVKDKEVRRYTHAQTRKEQCLDALQQRARDEVLGRFSERTRQWIQHGLELGNPRFVVNLGARLRLKADAAFADFIGDSETFEFICEAYRDGISEAVAREYYEQNPHPSGYYSYRAPRPFSASSRRCGLEAVLGENRDVRRFLRDDFTHGGWNAWIALIEDPGSNPYSAYLEQQDRLNTAIEEGRRNEIELLRQGRGFYPDLRCDEGGTLPDSLGRCPDGREPQIATPGNVVAGIAQKIINSDVDRALYSDEVNEVASDFEDTFFGKITQKGLRFAEDGELGSGLGLIQGEIERLRRDIRGFINFERDYAEANDAIRDVIHGGLTVNELSNTIDAHFRGSGPDVEECDPSADFDTLQDCLDRGGALPGSSSSGLGYSISSLGITEGFSILGLISDIEACSAAPQDLKIEAGNIRTRATAVAGLSGIEALEDLLPRLDELESRLNDENDPVTLDEVFALRSEMAAIPKHDFQDLIDAQNEFSSIIIDVFDKDNGLYVRAEDLGCLNRPSVSLWIVESVLGGGVVKEGGVYVIESGSSITLQWLTKRVNGLCQASTPGGEGDVIGWSGSKGSGSQTQAISDIDSDITFRIDCSGIGGIDVFSETSVQIQGGTTGGGGEEDLAPGGDEDNDGILNGSDNCPFDSNPNQSDSNNNGVGDVCDSSVTAEDLDGDGILNDLDNCTLVANSDQKNTDGDAFGDTCDTDDDNDGRLDVVDNCPLVVNANQQDSDNDGIGDVCDSSPLGDI